MERERRLWLEEWIVTNAAVKCLIQTHWYSNQSHTHRQDTGSSGFVWLKTSKGRMGLYNGNKEPCVHESGFYSTYFYPRQLCFYDNYVFFYFQPAPSAGKSLIKSLLFSVPSCLLLIVKTKSCWNQWLKLDLCDPPGWGVTSAWSSVQLSETRCQNTSSLQPVMYQLQSRKTHHICLSVPTT